MRYIFGMADFADFDTAEGRCFLMTNGLGGFCSQSIIGSDARGDHGVFLASGKQPSEKWMIVKQLEEKLCVDGKQYMLSSQRFVTQTDNLTGFNYLNSFIFEDYPVWEYMADGVSVTKRMLMPYNSDSVIVKYDVRKTKESLVSLYAAPAYGMHKKDDHSCSYSDISCKYTSNTAVVSGKDTAAVMHTDGEIHPAEEDTVQWYYYSQDSCDGRCGWGGAKKLHEITAQAGPGVSCFSLTIIFKTGEDSGADTADISRYAEIAFEQEHLRRKKIAESCGLHAEAAKQLAVASSAFITKRQDDGGMSIIAGYPFFGDWGRDTMISLYGCTMAIREYETAKNIMETFMRYCRRGIMPNLFPQGTQEPLYNTVDASLLFINAVWEYVNETSDTEFAFKALKTVNSIISWYAAGTDYDIFMDKDYLISAGSGLWQLTWMDVRYGDILPTPRHGKPVEINAYWYNAVRIYEELLKLALNSKASIKDTDDKAPLLDEVFKSGSLQEKIAYLENLAANIKKSFLEYFTKQDGTLYDIIGDERAAKQVRCNEVFALSVPFSMLDREQAQKILAQISRELYTPVGLRSLSVFDPSFHGKYGGSQFDRDMAYHQGTVWVYPLGDYYIACLKFAEDKRKTAAWIMQQLSAVQAAMKDGCVGFLAEIYDGERPLHPKGCFAQAWSSAQLLRVYKAAEEIL